MARAIYEYTRLGYTVLIPMTDSNKYDIVIEKDGCFKRVQVKTTSLREPSSKPGVYRAIIESRGGVQANKVIQRKSGDYDILFVMTVEDGCWSIPEDVITAKSTITVGTAKYQSYKL